MTLGEKSKSKKMVKTSCRQFYVIGGDFSFYSDEISKMWA